MHINFAEPNLFEFGYSVKDEFTNWFTRNRIFLFDIKKGSNCSFTNKPN